MDINEHSLAEFERVHAETVAIMQGVKQSLRNLEDLAQRIHCASGGGFARLAPDAGQAVDPALHAGTGSSH